MVGLLVATIKRVFWVHIAAEVGFSSWFGGIRISTAR